MPSEIIQWFPGHMAKTKRQIKESLPLVDIVIEILDARIPDSSHNPDIEKLAESKPRLILLNKATLASPEENARWEKRYREEGVKCILTDCNSGLYPSAVFPTPLSPRKRKIPFGLFGSVIPTLLLRTADVKSDTAFF